MWKIVFLCVLHVALVASKSILLEKMTEINGAETRSNSSDQFIEQSNEDHLVRSEKKILESIKVPQEIDQSSTLNNSSDEVSSKITTPKPIEPLRTEKPEAVLTSSSRTSIHPISRSTYSAPARAIRTVEDEIDVISPEDAALLREWMRLESSQSAAQSVSFSEIGLENSRSEDEYEQGLENLNYEQEMEKLEYLHATESAKLNHSSTVAMEGLAYERKQLELKYALAKKELNFAQAKNKLKHQHTQEKFNQSYSTQNLINQLTNSASYNGNGFSDMHRLPNRI